MYIHDKKKFTNNKFIMQIASSSTGTGLWRKLKLPPEKKDIIETYTMQQASNDHS